LLQARGKYAASSRQISSKFAVIMLQTRGKVVEKVWKTSGNVPTICAAEIAANVLKLAR
jgi:hypothetical protein